MVAIDADTMIQDIIQAMVLTVCDGITIASCASKVRELDYGLVIALSTHRAPPTIGKQHSQRGVRGNADIILCPVSGEPQCALTVLTVPNPR